MLKGNFSVKIIRKESANRTCSINIVAAILLVFSSLCFAKQPEPCQQIELASYEGVPAYSNGPYQGSGKAWCGVGEYGYQYQCVEYVKRFYREPGWYVTDAKAKNYWYEGNRLGLVRIPNPFGWADYPKAGDIAVFDSTESNSYGHVAIVTDSLVYGNGASLIEQNWSPTGTAWVNYDDAYTATRDSSSTKILGFLRKPEFVNPNIAYATLESGDPGKPGDKIFISINDGRAWIDMGYAIPSTGDVKVVGFASGNSKKADDIPVQIQASFRVSQRPNCEWGIGQAAQFTVVNGTQGVVSVVPQHYFSDWITEINYGQFGSNCAGLLVSRSDIELNWVTIYDQDGKPMSKIDAVGYIDN